MSICPKPFWTQSMSVIKWDIGIILSHFTIDETVFPFSLQRFTFIYSRSYHNHKKTLYFFCPVMGIFALMYNNERTQTCIHLSRNKCLTVSDLYLGLWVKGSLNYITSLFLLVQRLGITSECLLRVSNGLRTFWRLNRNWGCSQWPICSGATPGVWETRHQRVWEDR